MTNIDPGGQIFQSHPLTTIQMDSFSCSPLNTTLLFQRAAETLQYTDMKCRLMTSL